MRHLVLLLALFTASCSTFTYNLTDVDFPVSAKPAGEDAATKPLALGGKTVLWLHGLGGSSQPDVAALLKEHCGADCVGVADFRAEASTSFHDWLVTHLTLGFVRMKTVSITGQELVGSGN